MNAVRKRALKRVAVAFVAYELLFFIVDWLFDHRQPHGVLAYLLAIVPAIPMIGMIVMMGMYMVEEKDEFQRAMMTQALIWGIGGLLAFTTVWGLLEHYAGAPHLNSFFDLPIFALGAGAAKQIICRRYR